MTYIFMTPLQCLQKIVNILFGATTFLLVLGNTAAWYVFRTVAIFLKDSDLLVRSCCIPTNSW